VVFYFGIAELVIWRKYFNLNSPRISSIGTVDSGAIKEDGANRRATQLDIKLEKVIVIFVINGLLRCLFRHLFITF